MGLEHEGSQQDQVDEVQGGGACGCGWVDVPTPLHHDWQYYPMGWGRVGERCGRVHEVGVTADSLEGGGDVC